MNGPINDFADLGARDPDRLEALAGAIFAPAAAPDTRHGAEERTSPSHLHPEPTTDAARVNRIDNQAAAPSGLSSRLAPAPLWDAPPPGDEDAPPSRAARLDGGKPTVDVDVKDLRGMRRRVEAHLTGGKSKIYQRASGPSQLVVVDVSAEDRRGHFKRDAGTPYINELTAPRLAEFVTDKVTINTVKLTDDGPIRKATRPPEWFLNAMLDAREMRYPPLAGVTEAPTPRLDGSLITEAGYDEASGVLYLPSESFPPVPDRPTREEAERALESLQDVLTDFPFAEPHHRGAALALIMTPILRPGIDGPVPAFAIDGTTPGSGKGLLASIAGLLLSGREPGLAALTEDVELEKRITSLLLMGARLMVIDNVERPIGGNVLALLLTSSQWAGRVLGASTSVEVPQRLVVVFTGNQLRFSGDLPRRVVRVYLSPSVERPEERTGFRHPDIRAHVRAHRGELVAAVLTIFRAYVAAGSPLAGRLPSFGSFDAWTRAVREPLCWLGVADPWLSQKETREAGDPFLEEYRTFAEAARAIYGAKEFTVTDLIGRVDGPGASDDASDLGRLKTVLADWRRGKSTDVRNVASRVARAHGRVFGSLRVMKGERSKAGLLWRVADTKNESPESPIFYDDDGEPLVAGDSQRGLALR